ncbi:hypothetical protein [Nitriliruptor alkaliphilus]|nr:hypothetical protein [Nitriliruptor alkaliphilus]
MEIALVVFGVAIVALLWRLISAVERIEDEVVAARRHPPADPRSGDRRGT